MKLSYFFLAVTLAVIGVVSIAGFRGHHFSKPPMEIFPDMIYQDKVKDQLPSAFFPDGNSARAPIEGTVAIEMPARNDYWSTGKWDDTHWGDGIPVHDAVDGGRPLAIDAANIARGRERYTITCSVCHGAVGDGKGITSKYGMNTVATYQTDRIRNMNDGEIFNTITNGKGQMLGFGYNITIDDRWRIIMYLRALQRSQNASLSDASPAEQKQLQSKAGGQGGSASNASPASKAPVTYLTQQTMRGWIEGDPIAPTP
jgi:mono/diheme cytochrome c family protein